jgi:hypothetical protein
MSRRTRDLRSSVLALVLLVGCTNASPQTYVVRFGMVDLPDPSLGIVPEALPVEEARVIALDSTLEWWSRCSAAGSYDRRDHRALWNLALHGEDDLLPTRATEAPRWIRAATALGRSRWDRCRSLDALGICDVPKLVR